MQTRLAFILAAMLSITMLQGQNKMTPIQQTIAANLAKGELAWTHLGQQGFLLKFGKTIITIDAYLTPSKGRNIPPLLQPEDFEAIQFVLGTHNHSDHIDKPTWKKIAALHSHVKFVIPADVLDEVAASTGILKERFIGLDDGKSATLGELKVTGIAAAHEYLDRNPITGQFPYLGYVVEGSGIRIFHAGDTCIYEGFAQKLRQFRPYDLMMLPINGRDARRLKGNCIGNMTFQEAADLAGALQPVLAIPAHFDMFNGNTENPQNFIDYYQVKYPELGTTIPQPGNFTIYKQQQPPRAATPREKIENDSYDWYERHKEKCLEAKQKNHDIVMMGDSITHFWENRHGPKTWKQLFQNRDVLNLGFGWDRTCNLIYRLENGEFENQTPKLFVLHIGTNNLSATKNYPDGDTPEQTAQGILAVIDRVLQRSPKTKIILMAVFPRGLNSEPYREKINALNKILKKATRQRPEIRLVDIGPKMMKDGELNTSLYMDNCHLNEKGYQVWAEALDQIFISEGL